VIRYTIPAPPLADRVDDKKFRNWRTRAARRTARFKKEGRFAEKSSSWSEVKPLYMTLQGENKCVYCERKFGSAEASMVEHDLEHFRPKSHVDGWTPPLSLQQVGVTVTQPTANNTGYYLLPYHLENYASSCKTCNTRYKLDRFPIAGAYAMKGTDPRALLSERPLLIYPVGDLDIDPETAIEFLGFMPQAKAVSPDYFRGLVTIAFFGLDDIDMRSDLFLERAQIIVSMKRLLEDANDQNASAADRHAAQARVNRFTSEKSPHANCARSFERLFKNDRVRADACFKAADEYWASKS
jgi:hypothetical protein